MISATQQLLCRTGAVCTVTLLGLAFAVSTAAAAVGIHDPNAVATATPGPPTAPAGNIILDFEGLADQEAVNEFYNGGTGGSGSGPGANYGVSFSTNSLALIDSDDGGSGNFGGEPSPDTILFFLSGGAATMNVPGGFTTGFSFFYSAINNPGVIRVYDGLNATGNLLATLDLPLTPAGGAPDPTGDFSPLVPIGVTFAGTAMSVDFGGTVNQVGFDNITLGSGTPGGGGPPPPPSIPTPTLSLWWLFALIAVLAVAGLTRRT
ncbi:MAG: hypothetical protein WBQ57_06660, partial [Rhodanobacteraceae bacterium]